jgi:hypothetical protein
MCHSVFSTKDFESRGRHSEIRVILPRLEGRDENGRAQLKRTEYWSNGVLEYWAANY